METTVLGQQLKMWKKTQKTNKKINQNNFSKLPDGYGIMKKVWSVKRE